MYLMELLWNSPDKVDAVRFFAQWISVITVIVSLIFSMRANALKKHIDAEETKKDFIERTLFENKIKTAEGEAILARLESAEAKAKLQPRILSEKQSHILREELIVNSHLGMKSGIPIIVSAKMMDEESVNYAKQIYHAINNIGWEVEFTPMSSHVFQGIAIFFNPRTKQSESCKAVQNAFIKADVKFSSEYLNIKQIPIQAENAIYIIVGYK